MLPICCCGGRVCPAHAVATEACSSQTPQDAPLTRERPGTCRKPAESGVSTRPRLHPTRRINAQQSLPVIRHANWSEMPDFRPEKTKARGGVMRSRKPLWRFLRFLGLLLLVFLLLAAWGGRAPS